MPNYQAQNQNTLSRQLKVQELVIPLNVTANATPASKTQTTDEPSMLFINTEGITGISTTTGAFDTSAEANAITFASANDANGIYNLLLRVGEQVGKVVHAEVHKNLVSGATEVLTCSSPTGATRYVTSLGDKLVFNLDSAVNFASTNYDATLHVKYIVAE